MILTNILSAYVKLPVCLKGLIQWHSHGDERPVDRPPLGRQGHENIHSESPKVSLFYLRKGFFAFIIQEIKNFWYLSSVKQSARGVHIETVTESFPRKAENKIVEE